MSYCLLGICAVHVWFGGICIEQLKSIWNPYFFATALRSSTLRASMRWWLRSTGITACWLVDATSYWGWRESRLTEPAVMAQVREWRHSVTSTTDVYVQGDVSVDAVILFILCEFHIFGYNDVSNHHLSVISVVTAASRTPGMQNLLDLDGKLYSVFSLTLHSTCTLNSLTRMVGFTIDIVNHFGCVTVKPGCYKCGHMDHDPSQCTNLPLAFGGSVGKGSQ